MFVHVSLMSVTQKSSQSPAARKNNYLAFNPFETRVAYTGKLGLGLGLENFNSFD